MSKFLFWNKIAIIRIFLQKWLPKTWKMVFGCWNLEWALEGKKIEFEQLQLIKITTNHSLKLNQPRLAYFWISSGNHHDFFMKQNRIKSPNLKKHIFLGFRKPLCASFLCSEFEKCEEILNPFWSTWQYFLFLIFSNVLFWLWAFGKIFFLPPFSIRLSGKKSSKRFY